MSLKSDFRNLNQKLKMLFFRLFTIISTLPSRYRDRPFHTVTHRFLLFFHRFLPFRTIISFALIFWQQEIRKTKKSNKTNNKYTVSVFDASYTDIPVTRDHNETLFKRDMILL